MGDTRHLTTTEHGAYFLLMLAAWRNPDCGLPDDDGMLGRITGSANNWKKIKPVVMAMWYLEGGRWYQKRLLQTHKNVKARVAQKKQAAAASVLKRQQTGSTDVAADTQRGANGRINNQNHNQTVAKASEKPPTPKKGAGQADAAGAPVGKTEEPAIAMPHTGALPPAAWGNWALQGFTAGRVRIEEEWVLFVEYWTLGKGKKTKRTAHGWEISWRTWCRKAFGGMERGPGGGQPPGGTSAAHNPQARQVGAGAETL